MLVGQWFAPGRTPTHATSSTKWRVTSCAWIEASLTPGMTSKSLQACWKRAGGSVPCATGFPHPGGVAETRKDAKERLMPLGSWQRQQAISHQRNQKEKVVWALYLLII